MNEMTLLESTFDHDGVACVQQTKSSSCVSSCSFDRHRGVVVTNRLSAPECSTDATGVALCKTQTSSSLVDVNESQFHCFYCSAIPTWKLLLFTI